MYVSVLKSLVLFVVSISVCVNYTCLWLSFSKKVAPMPSRNVEPGLFEYFLFSFTVLIIISFVIT